MRTAIASPTIVGSWPTGIGAPTRARQTTPCGDVAVSSPSVSPPEAKLYCTRVSNRSCPSVRVFVMNPDPSTVVNRGAPSASANPRSDTTGSSPEMSDVAIDTASPT